jgi:tetratricopeptide (TPR) repeat protein
MAVTSVISDELTTLASSGRFATVLCRLARVRMTGVVYVERAEGGAVVSLRDGAPVFIEDLGGADPLGDAMLAQEVITPEQYAMIMEHTLSDLAGSEDVAFATKAVELGVLTQAAVDAELVRRVRGQLIQALSWDSARIEIDEDPDALTGPEYPLSLGSLLYMAVRTFFDEERVSQLLGDHRELYLRLVRPRAEVADDLGLDDSERELLEAFDPPSSVRSAIDRLAVDSLEAHQLVAMLVLAEHVEHGTRPWSAPIEVPSQQRAARPAPMGRYVATELTEERLGPAVTPRARPAEPRRPTPERTQPRGSPPSVPIEDDYAFSAPEAPPARPASQPQPVAKSDAARAERSAQAASQAAASNPAPQAAAFNPAPQATAFNPAPRPVSIRPQRDPAQRPRRLGAALKRLGKELQDRRAHTQQLEPEPAPLTAAAPSNPNAGSGVQPAPTAPASAEPNAVRELIRRRRAMASQVARGATDKKGQTVSPAELVRSAQDAMREQQFGRAQELFAKACEAEPSNDVFRMFRLWAAFRANALQEGEIITLKNAVREKLNDDLHKAFAYYAMGHISVSDKKDDAAEKFFRKAMELDKTNKDAERHLRLIEIRRKTAATEGQPQKIFGIEIGPKKS